MLNFKTVVCIYPEILNQVNVVLKFVSKLNLNFFCHFFLNSVFFNAIKTLLIVFFN